MGSESFRMTTPFLGARMKTSLPRRTIEKIGAGRDLIKSLFLINNIEKYDHLARALMQCSKWPRADPELGSGACFSPRQFCVRAPVL
jgi:hypothetical protein